MAPAGSTSASGAGNVERRQRGLSDCRRLLAALGLADDAMGIKVLSSRVFPVLGSRFALAVADSPSLSLRLAR
jgi:hypothetical protein